MKSINDLDLQYFKHFHRDAAAASVTLEDHYLNIQIGTSGETEKEPPHNHPGLEPLIQILDPKLTYLVVGCGAGAEIGWLMNNGCKNVTGLDICEHLLDNCRKRFSVSTVLADMRKTGIEPGAYDVVLTHRSLHHMFYPFAALEEIARIASKMVMILNEPRKLWHKDLVRSILRKRIISGAQIYEYQFDYDDVERYMLFNGFRTRKHVNFWESGAGKQDVFHILSKALPNLGNRFSAVFEKL
jgi:SAM-dependent methyltransferase